MYDNISKLFSIFGGQSSIIRFEILNCLYESRNFGLSPTDIVEKIQTKLKEEKLNYEIFLKKSKEITSNNLYHHIKALLELHFIRIVEKDSSLKIKKYGITDNGEIFLDFIKEFYSNTHDFKEIGIYFQDNIIIDTRENILLEEIQNELLLKNYEKTPFIDYRFQNKVIKLRNIKMKYGIYTYFSSFFIIAQEEEKLNLDIEIQLIVPIQKNKDATNRYLDKLLENKSIIFLFANILLDMILDIKEVLINIIKKHQNLVTKNKDEYVLWFNRNKILKTIDQKITDISNSSLQNYIELDRVYMK